MWLGIETSSSQASLALVKSHSIREEVLLQGNRAAEALLPTLDALLSRHNVLVADISDIAVARGPGSFAGIRSGMATAKALAFATKARLHAVPSSYARAWSALHDAQLLQGATRFGVLTNSHGGQVFLCTLRYESGHLRYLQSQLIAPSSEIEWSEFDVVCVHDIALAETLAHAARSRVLLASASAISLIESAAPFAEAHEGLAEEWFAAEPIYARGPLE